MRVAALRIRYLAVRPRLYAASIPDNVKPVVSRFTGLAISGRIQILPHTANL